jgi:hypothetical protein
VKLRNGRPNFVLRAASLSQLHPDKFVPQRLAPSHCMSPPERPFSSITSQAVTLNVAPLEHAGKLTHRDGEAAFIQEPEL